VWLSVNARLTAANIGLAQPDAERRVDDVAARAKDNIACARRRVLSFSPSRQERRS
jgi:hypothetical protein